MGGAIADVGALNVTHIRAGGVLHHVDLVFDQVCGQLFEFELLAGGLLAPVEEVDKLLDEIVASSQLRVPENLLHDFHEFFQRHGLVRVHKKLL